MSTNFVQNTFDRCKSRYFLALCKFRKSKNALRFLIKVIFDIITTKKRSSYHNKKLYIGKIPSCRYFALFLLSFTVLKTSVYLVLDMPILLCPFSLRYLLRGI